jgi:geranylgeranyl diphosphate synthase type I
VIGTRAAVTAPDVLLRTKPAVEQGLRHAVDQLPALLRRPVAYHLGWTDRDGRSVAAVGGKAVRPAIVLLAAQAVGGTVQQALTGATALELAHNFSLLHDDVMDGDAERRHRPTVWAVFGPATAILAGDALLTLAHQVLLADPRPAARRAADALSAATAEMILGQAEDLSFESRPDVTEDECLAMSRHKTAALMGCAGTLGAILGGGDEAAVRTLEAFGRHLGLAFQAVDDVLGIWGDPAVTGKPAAGDLRQRKKTLPVVHAMAGGTGADRLHRILGNTDLDMAAVAHAMAALAQADSRAWTIHVAERSLAQALECLERAELRSGPVSELRAVAEFIIRRDH